MKTNEMVIGSVVVITRGGALPEIVGSVGQVVGVRSIPGGGIDYSIRIRNTSRVVRSVPAEWMRFVC